MTEKRQKPSCLVVEDRAVLSQGSEGQGVGEHVSYVKRVLLNCTVVFKHSP